MPCLRTHRDKNSWVIISLCASVCLWSVLYYIFLSDLAVAWRWQFKNPHLSKLLMLFEHSFWKYFILHSINCDGLLFPLFFLIPIFWDVITLENRRSTEKIIAWNPPVPNVCWIEMQENRKNSQWIYYADNKSVWLTMATLLFAKQYYQTLLSKSLQSYR